MRLNLGEQLRRRMREGETLFGVFCKATTPEWIECIGYAGFDFCILDREHGAVDTEHLLPLIQAANGTGMAPIVRTADGSAAAIGHALDLGASGIQIPQVDSLSMAQDTVAESKFAPMGRRGLCRFVRAAHYSQLPREIYFQEANQSLVILQLEDTQEEVYRTLAGLEGVDVLFIGPYDLSQRMGLPGQVDHPTVVAEIRRLISIAREHGKAVGIFADTTENAQRWIDAGCQYIAYSVDVGIFSDACRGIVAALQRWKAERNR